MIRLRTIGDDQVVKRYWNCSVRSCSLRNGGNFGVEMILKRLGIAWTSEESSDVPRRVERYTCRHAERGQILTTTVTKLILVSH